MKGRWLDLGIVVIAALILLTRGGGIAPSSPDQVVYTYEKDQGDVPNPVQAALNVLNRQGIRATIDEADATDGPGETPDQYKVSRPAAKAAGLPALVVLDDGKVVRVVKDPKTAEAVMEAAK